MGLQCSGVEQRNLQLKFSVQICRDEVSTCHSVDYWHSKGPTCLLLCLCSQTFSPCVSGPWY